MAAPTPTHSPPPITLSIAESAGVAFGGAFVGALAVEGDYSSVGIVKAAVVAAVAFFGALGYGGYQAHVASK